MTHDPFGEEAPLVDINEFPKWIIYEDADYLVLNKPGWLVCHPSKNGDLSSLVGASRVYTKLDSLHLVSRLDRETSGIVILAKHKKAASVAQRALEHGLAKKEYFAIMQGAMNFSATVSQPLIEDKNSLVAIKQMCAMRKTTAKKACTYFTPQSVANNYTLCKVRIITGRKHQIRAHAQWLGYPIVGDKIYGPDETLYLDFIEKGFTDEMAKLLPMKRQALHAFKLDLSAAIKDFSFTAPPTADFVEFAEKNSLVIPKS